jgi:DNA polymerase elongation subunit (family B)
LDNAEAVTLSGQDIIKTTEKFVNARFNKLCSTTDVDYAVYMDTDSCYVSADPIARSLGHDVKDPVFMKQFTIQTATDTATAINSFYDVMMPRLFFTKAHRIKIAEDVIAKSAIWLAKKRYAMLKVYDMELKKDLDSKLDAKGIDIVRSSFPIKFKTVMEEMIMKILNDKDNKELD